MWIAVRALGKHRAFTLPALVALALGIGAATIIFSMVDCVLLRPLPYPESGRLVSVAAAFPDGAEIVPSTEFLNWSRATRTLESFAAQGAGGPASLIAADGASQVTIQKVTIGFLGTLRVQPFLGRDFGPADGTVGAPNVALISYSLWQSRFGGGRGALGRSLNLDGTLYRVIGVLPASFRYLPSLAPLDVLLPLQIAPSFYTDRNEMRAWHCIGRLKRGVTVDQARAEFGPLLATAIHDTAREMPRLYTGARLRILPYRDYITGGVRTALLLLLGGVACVLLIACGNVANLLLARGAGRRRELAIRSALGASRARLLRHLLGESLLLAAAGGALGSVICFAAVPAIRSLMAHKLPRIAELNVDLRVLAFALALSLATGLVFGLLPAWHASRAALHESLKRATPRAGRWLAAAELALSLTLLVSAGLLIQSLWRIQHRHIGFEPDHLLVADVSLRGTRFAHAPQAGAGPQGWADVAIEAQLARIPGAVAWAVADGLPPNGGCCGITFSRRGHPAMPSRDRGDLTIVRHVTTGYFGAMRIALKRGRLLDAHDTQQPDGAVLVNEALVRRYFAGEDPIGQTINLRPTVTVVGIVADARNDGLAAPVRPELILPFRGASAAVQVALRSSGDPLLLASALRQELHDLDPLIQAKIHTMREEFQDQTAQPRFIGGLFTVFALVALALAMVGIYGVMAFAVAGRTREIGIRMALGAAPGRVERMVLWDAAVPVASGMLLGTAGSLAAARYLAGVLHEIGATDPPTYVVVATLLGGVAFAASLAPARRASQVDPAVVLRAE